MRIYKATLVLFLVCFVWLLCLFIAPLTLPSNTVHFGERGVVGKRDYSSEIKEMNPFASFFYDLGDTQCHQKSSRSLFINGNQMPFCARDVGIFVGFALGAGIAVFRTINVRWWWIIVGLVPIGVDGTVQLLTEYESNNPLRIITGGLTGTVTMLALGMVLQDISSTVKLGRRKKGLQG